MKPDIYIHLKKHKNIFFTLKDEIRSCFRSININVFVVFMKCLIKERENCYVFFLLLSSKSEVLPLCLVCPETVSLGQTFLVSFHKLSTIACWNLIPLLLTELV